MSWAQLTVCQDLLLGYFMEQFVECFVVFHKALQRDESPTLHTFIHLMYCYDKILICLSHCYDKVCAAKRHDLMYIWRTYMFVDEPIWMLMVLLCYGLLAGEKNRNNVIRPLSKFSFFSFPPVTSLWFTWVEQSRDTALALGCSVGRHPDCDYVEFSYHWTCRCFFFHPERCPTWANDKDQTDDSAFVWGAQAGCI